MKEQSWRALSSVLTSAGFVLQGLWIPGILKSQCSLVALLRHSWDLNWVCDVLTYGADAGVLNIMH